MIGGRKRIWLWLGGLTLLAILLLSLIPPERTLDRVIRVIFLHGALVQVGLWVFAAAGLLGLFCLVKATACWCGWCLAAQKAGFLVWAAYALSSMLATYLSWGEWIAWEEPRVRSTAHILWFSLVCLLLVLWVDSPRFTGMVNIAVALSAWFLVKGASIVRHPFDPIGTSGSVPYRVLYGALLLVVALMAWLLVRLLHRPAPAPPEVQVGENTGK